MPPRLNVLGQGGLHLSPTRVQCHNLCVRKWAAQYVTGFEGAPAKLISDMPITTAQQRKAKRTLEFGTEMHLLAEYWFKRGEKPPSTLEGLTLMAGLKYWPVPGTPGLEAEYSWSIPFEGTVFQGTADLVHFREDGTVMLGDHKTTGNIGWAKTPEMLLQDEQCMTYAYAIMLETGVDELDIQWVYYQRVEDPEEVAKTKKVTFTVHRRHVQKQWEKVAESARNMLRLYEAKVRPEDMPGNPKACTAFYGCRFVPNCASLKEKDIEVYMSEEKSKMEAMKAKLAAKSAARKAAKEKSGDAPPVAKKAAVKRLQAVAPDEPAAEPIVKKKKKVTKAEEAGLTAEAKENINDLVLRFLELSGSFNEALRKLITKLDKID